MEQLNLMDDDVDGNHRMSSMEDIPLLQPGEAEQKESSSSQQPQQRATTNTTEKQAGVILLPYYIQSSLVAIFSRRIECQTQCQNVAHVQKLYQ
jgi:hypothetical protein